MAAAPGEASLLVMILPIPLAATVTAAFRLSSLPIALTLFHDPRDTDGCRSAETPPLPDPDRPEV